MAVFETDAALPGKRHVGDVFAGPAEVVEEGRGGRRRGRNSLAHEGIVEEQQAPAKFSRDVALPEWVVHHAAKVVRGFDRVFNSQPPEERVARN